ncbi:MAG: phenylacetate--CoA ligase family protein [Rhodothermia bacterium]|nr:MAG: phenylacetate--CoA ligase family protein [Rhodothermia bacterium]
MPLKRREKTRARWLETLASHRRDFDAPASEDFWSPSLDTASRDELTNIQNTKLAVLTPFLYENSGFYRRRFDRLGMTPEDIRTIDDLPKWPVIDKAEMMEDAIQYPPYGTYATMSEELWRERGWMQFSSSGSTGIARIFRYSHIDRGYWEWANARALYSMGIRRGDTVFPMGGFGPHVWQWGVTYSLARMGIAMIPGGGMDARARATVIERFKPSVVACTPSYALHLGQVMKDMGGDPNKSSIQTLFTAGEPALGIEKTRERLENLWGCRLVEFYGCTEVSPHCGGYTCPASAQRDRPVSIHLMEDVQIWELVDDSEHQPVQGGESGLTVCTSLNSESSPQLRFLVGDYTRFDHSVCDCGRTHVRAIGACTGRADDIINIRGIKLLPSHIEQAVRAIAGTGDEFEIVLSTKSDGLDVMTIRVEHPELNIAHIATSVAKEVRSRCEIRVDVEVLAPGTLPKTEFKAKRVRDERR